MKKIFKTGTGGKKGFTLIELLVVISIIALLLSILMPSLARVKELAYNVTCRARLRQWGLMFKMFTQDNGGKFFEGYSAANANNPDEFEKIWFFALEDYHNGDDEIRFCPMAKKPYPEGNGAYEAWGFEYRDPDNVSVIKYEYGSYCLNGWARDPEPDDINELTEAFYWRSPDNIKRADEVPLFGDGWWFQGSPYDEDDASFSSDYLAPPPSNGARGKRNAYIGRYCIDRHNGSINMAFMDGGAREVPLKELWELKWHQKFNTRNRYTQAGGVQPSDWPEWMQEL